MTEWNGYSTDEAEALGAYEPLKARVSELEEVMAWAYSKLSAFGVGTINIDSALMMNRIKLLLETGQK